MRRLNFLSRASAFAAGAAMLLGASAMVQADTVSESADIENFDDQEYVFNFSLDEISSIDSVVIEMSHSNINQVVAFLENSPATGDPYVIYNLISGPGTGTGNEVGEDSNYTDLLGLSELTLVESGAASTVRDATGPVPSGTYLAEDWEENFGTGSAPYAADDWRLVIRDNSTGSAGAIGTVSVNFTPTAVPEPGSLAGLALLGLGAFVRRRRV